MGRTWWREIRSVWAKLRAARAAMEADTDMGEVAIRLTRDELWLLLTVWIHVYGPLLDEDQP